jgi:WhiB family redox-sensing transcriptional regulator
VARMIAEEGWRSVAACRSADPELFFPISASGKALEQVMEAKAICADCWVRRECLSFALRTQQKHGVWGGMTEQERYLAGWLHVRSTDSDAGDGHAHRAADNRIADEGIHGPSPDVAAGSPLSSRCTGMTAHAAAADSELAGSGPATASTEQEFSPLVRPLARENQHNDKASNLSFRRYGMLRSRLV